ncbi:MAG: sulfatase-like hydrolase/transferase [Bryobacteraceae bacterium]|nr:sulfatase-like hydrolase/transferase [Bryobacteraceae bacterium]
MKRREFLTTSTGVAVSTAVSRGQSVNGGSRPNILIVLVDQLRTPRWFPAQPELDRLLPNLTRIRQGAVAFKRHYTASNACTAARACLLTGLYTHQSAMFITGAGGFGVPLQTGFPTWGSLLRQSGYQTNWFGKWHISEGNSLEPYGFAGGTFPDPIGTPGQGARQDAGIVDQFAGWFANQGSGQPWCTTVSLVNPHDIAFYPRLTNQFVLGSNAPTVFRSGPPNIESPEDLVRNRKPRLQRAFQESLDVFQGQIPLRGAPADAAFARMLDWFLYCQQLVDVQVGRVLDILASDPGLAANTVVIFTTDHGEYGGSHGLRNKGAGAYEEAIHIPLYIKDPRGVLTRQPEAARMQITSSVDILPLLLTIATGGTTWRNQPGLAHLATRIDLAAIAANPGVPGRAYAIHATDEALFDEFSLIPPPRLAADHVIAIVNDSGKYATYSNWQDGTNQIMASGMEYEAYDYATEPGRQELDNVAYSQPLRWRTWDEVLHRQAIPAELRRPLQPALQPVQEAAYASYFSFLQSLGPLNR